MDERGKLTSNDNHSPQRSAEPSECPLPNRLPDESLEESLTRDEAVRKISELVSASERVEERRARSALESRGESGELRGVAVEERAGGCVSRDTDARE